MEYAPFGSTGHRSSRILFGAAALGAMRQEKADQVLAQLLPAGVNHIDTAASYGESELRLAPWLRTHRDAVFLATKTGDRTAAGARRSIADSLARLGVARLDLVQLHNLVDEEGWQTAMGPGGALEALVEARDRGLVRFLGVTGHGTYAAAMHHRSLRRFPFDSVLLPYSYVMMANPDYAADCEALLSLCATRGVAVQTIKAVARRRWQDDHARRFSWYEPLRDAAAIRRAVHFVLARPGLFLNSSSDATLLPSILAAAAEPVSPPSAAALAADVAAHGMQPLFVRDVSDAI
ncbi:MAG: aldo/keto reductase [Deltaproteobacteria bacterium]|nr:aldo/keto reductase [Deltaproteobacteria bacterium]